MKIVCKVCNEENKKSTAYVHCARVNGAVICAEHCDTCIYQDLHQGDLKCMYTRKRRSQNKRLF